MFIIAAIPSTTNQPGSRGLFIVIHYARTLLIFITLINEQKSTGITKTTVLDCALLILYPITRDSTGVNVIISLV